MNVKKHTIINGLTMYLNHLGVDKKEIESRFTAEQKDEYIKIALSVSEDVVIEKALDMLDECLGRKNTPEDWEEEQHL